MILKITAVQATSDLICKSNNRLKVLKLTYMYGCQSRHTKVHVVASLVCVIYSPVARVKMLRVSGFRIVLSACGCFPL